jgi:hypothetical protein
MPKKMAGQKSIGWKAALAIEPASTAKSGFTERAWQKARQSALTSDPAVDGSHFKA